MIEEIPPKKCIGPCGQEFPATVAFFESRPLNRDGLSNTCRKCLREQAQYRRLVRTGQIEGEVRPRGRPRIRPLPERRETPVKMKTHYCNNCRQSRPADCFDEQDARIDASGKIRYRCHACMDRAQSRITAHSATRNTPTEHCAACGTKSGNLRGDIELATGQRYGILCSKCYQIMEASKGDSERVASVARYLKKTRYLPPPANAGEDGHENTTMKPITRK